jgi:hypothetical protein
LLSALRPLTELSNRSTGELRLKGGGSVDIWSLGFRIGDKDAWKRSDDLFDALVCGALLGFEPDK